MSFVLFNVSDEIVSREKAGVAYQEGNNKVCVLFMGNRTREFGEKIMEICQMIQSKLKELMALGCFNQCGKLGKDTAGASGVS